MAKELKQGMPKEAQVMASILKDMGITEYEPGVINQMLEFSYRYVTQVLDDARTFANYAKKSKPIELDDVKLAIHMQVEKSFTSPPPRDLLLELANARNANPLPTINKSHHGIRLPPDRYCLSSCNYKLKSAVGKKMTASTIGGKINLTGASGVKVTKSTVSMVTGKGGTTQTMTLIQKPGSGINASPAQKIVNINRPVIKVTPGPPGGVLPKISLSSVNPDSMGLNENCIKQEDSGLKRKRDDGDDG